MGNQKRTNKAGAPQTPDDLLNPLPGVTGEGAEKTVFLPTGGKTGGLYSDPGDGTLADQPAERARTLNDPYADEQRDKRTREESDDAKPLRR